MQEFLGQFYAPMARQDWMPGAIVSTLLVVVAWGYFIWTGSISTIWPMFGIANQLLAVGRARRRHDDHHQHRQGALRVGDAACRWRSSSITTLTAGVLSVRDNFWPMAIGPDPARHFQGYLNTGLTVMMMVSVVVILVNAAWRCVRVLTGRVPLRVADVA